MMMMKRTSVEGAGARAERHHLVSLGAVAMVCMVSLLLVCAMPRSAAAKPPGWSGDKTPSPAAKTRHPLPRRGEGGGEGGGAGGDRAGIPAEAMASIERIMDMARAMGMEVVLDYHDDGSITVFEEGSGTGASLDARGDKLVTEFDGSPPSVIGADGRAVSGGGAKGKGRGSAVMVPEGVAANPLLWAGLLCLLGSGVAVYFKLFRAAVIGAGVGAVLIAAALYPALALLGAAAVIGIGVVLYLRSENAAKRKGEALLKVARGVDSPSVPAEAREQVKAAIAYETDLKDRDVIDKVKRSDHIGKYAPEG